MKCRWTTLLMAALGLACLLGAGMLDRPLRHARESGHGNPAPDAAWRGAPPMLELTEAEKQATRKAFETCGLKMLGAAQKPSAA